MKILIIGGTGNISWRLTTAARDEGWDVTVFNRGARTRRRPPPGCRLIACDIRDRDATEAALAGADFDVVVDFLCYNGQQALDAVASFRNRTQHYVFISTTALYDRPVARLPLTESSPLLTNGWDYALAKAQAERVFAEAQAREGFPVSVVRPAHTYDLIIPEAVGNGDWTNPWRMLNGKPIVVHGDGTTLWTLTHSVDLASGIVALVRSGRGCGQTFHITSSEAYTWREITAIVCETIGASSPKICYRTTEEIDRISPRLGNGLKGHKMWCDVYDNTRFKAACPDWQATTSLEAGIRETVRQYRENPDLMTPNRQLDAVLDEICGLR
jgi:nucleoside-diphosphate-sugar epimerase